MIAIALAAMAAEPPGREVTVTELRVARRVEPTFPSAGWRLDAPDAVCEGTAAVEATGTVSSAVALDCHPVFAEAARAALLQWRFEPTIEGGDFRARISFVRPTALAERLGVPAVEAVAESWEGRPDEEGYCRVGVVVTSRGVLARGWSNRRPICLAVPSPTPAAPAAALADLPDSRSCLLKVEARRGRGRVTADDPRCAWATSRWLRQVVRAWWWNGYADDASTSYQVELTIAP